MSKAAERTQRQLLELLKLPGNDVCADCRSRNPRWASWDHGIFICVQCAGIHRKMGTHISKVKSLTLDTWSREQVEHMRTHGNTTSNELLNPGSAAQPPPSSADEGERESQLEKFIRDKYEYRTFVDTALPQPRPAPIASSPPVTSSPAPLLAKPPTHPQRRGSSPGSATVPPHATRSSTIPPASTFLVADEPAPTIPPRPFANTPSNLTPSPEGVKHVRFRSTSVPIPDIDEPLRVPSAAGVHRQPAKGILRPSSAMSASASTPSIPSVTEDGRGMNWGAAGRAGAGGSDLGTGLPPGVLGQGRTPSSASTASFASMMSQGSAMSNGSMFSSGSTATTLSSLGAPSAYGGGTNPFTGAPMTPGYQQQTAYGQPLRAFSSSPAPTPIPAPASAPPPPQPQRLNSSIWDDLDFLDGVSPSASPAPPTQHSSTLYPSAQQQPSFASSTSSGQARTASPFAPSSTSSSTYNPPTPAPLRPQLTGFVPSSQFGQQMANEVPGSGSNSASAPFLRPQQTGYTSSSSLQASAQTGSSHLSPLRPQQTGFAPPPSHSPLPNGPAPTTTSPFPPLPHQQQQHTSFFTSHSQQQPSYLQHQPSPFLPSPSPSSLQPQQLQPSSTSTNPFQSSMLSPSPLSMGGLGNALPQVQTPMQTAGGGGTTPFFSSYQSQAHMQPMRSQATRMPMSSFGGAGAAAGFGAGGGGSFVGGGGGGYGAQPQMQQPMATGMVPQQPQQQLQSTNPFFGFGGAAQGQQGQQGQYGRPWGS